MPNVLANGSSRPPRFWVVMLVLMAAFNGVVVWRVRDSIVKGYGDFASFYTAGRIVASGQSGRLYDPRMQWQVQQQFASQVKTRVGPLPYIRPPFEALLFAPLSYFSYPAACWLWLGVKAALLLAVPFLLPTSGDEWGGIRILAGFAFFPVGFDLVQGQDSILLLVILVCTMRSLLRGEELRSGAILGLGLFKFHIVGPLFLAMAFRRGRKFSMGFCAVGAALLLISLGMVGWSGLVRYPQYLMTLNRVPGFGMVKTEAMPNVRGILSVLLGNGPLPRVAQGFLVMVVAFGILVAARLWRDADPRQMIRSFSFAVALVLLTSYYANSYDLTLLLLPALSLGKSYLDTASGWRGKFLLASAGILVCTPLLWAVVLSVNQFCWVALVVAGFAVALMPVRSLPARSFESAR